MNTRASGTTTAQRNFFVHEEDASRYAASRPYFHPWIVERLDDVLPQHERLCRALDVACGTGLSTRALRELVPRVVGLDASRGMLRTTAAGCGIQYSCGLAESLPFGNQSFDLLSVGCAIHWFDQEAFLDEASRLLRPGGWLVLYNDAFGGTMRENPVFQDWIAQRYLEWYPSPPRNAAKLNPGLFERAGFREYHQEDYEHLRGFSPASLVDYLTTQSTVITAIRDRGEALAQIRLRLLEAVQPFFPASEGRFLFKGWLLVLRAE